MGIGCSDCGQPGGQHLPNCSTGGTNATLNWMRNAAKFSAVEKRSKYYPKGPDGKPVPEKDLTSYEIAFAKAKGNSKRIGVDAKGNCFYSQHDLPRDQRFRGKPPKNTRNRTN